MQPRVRRAVRALVVSADREILLMRLLVPHSGRRFWITPGGAIEPGEGERDALSRELAEETGLTGATIGPEVWTRQVSLRWEGEPIIQSERYFWVRAARFEPSMAGMPEPEERELVDALRWWSLAEIERSEQRFAPSRLGALLRELLEAGPPERPIDVGV